MGKVSSSPYNSQLIFFKLSKRWPFFFLEITRAITDLKTKQKADK